jgi:hypothetical protein
MDPPCDISHTPDAAASTASHPASVTTRDPPLLGGGTAREVATDLGSSGSEIFFEGGLDDPNQTELSREIRLKEQDRNRKGWFGA